MHSILLCITLLLPAIECGTVMKRGKITGAVIQNPVAK